MQFQMNLIGKIAERDDVPNLSYGYLRDTFENLEETTLTNFLLWINERGMIVERDYVSGSKVQSYIL